MSSTKYTVKITNKSAKVVEFQVVYKLVGRYPCVAGQGTVAGSRGSYCHMNMAGWDFTVDGDVTEESIHAALTDRNASFHLT